MATKKKNGELLALVRAKGQGIFLDPIWDECRVDGLVGRCPGSAFNGSTIILALGVDEIIVLCENKSGNVIEMRQYRLVGKTFPTRLAERIAQQIELAGVKLVKDT